LLNIVDCKRHVLESADPIFVASRREQHQTGLGARNLKLDPPLAFAHRLIGRNLEPDLFGPEREGLVLISDGNSYELDLLHHDVLISVRLAELRGRDVSHENSRLFHRAMQLRDIGALAIMAIACGMLSLDPYLVEVLLPDLVGHDKRPSSFV